MDSFPKNMRILILSKLMGGESREVYWELRTVGRRPVGK